MHVQSARLARDSGASAANDMLVAKDERLCIKDATLSAAELV